VREGDNKIKKKFKIKTRINDEFIGVNEKFETYIDHIN